MTEKLLLLNNLVATGTLVSEIVLALFVIYFTLNRKSFYKFINNLTNIQNKISKSWTQLFLILVFILSLAASTMTLVYSEYFGVIPCALCWLERIFMYSTVILSGSALYFRDERFIFRYINVFAVFGLVISLYHHILQMTATASSSLPCPASGGDCAKRLIYEYGHITFPWLAVVLFATFIFIYFINKNLENK
jgi:disulfide bond formation protein DsbB